MKLKTVNVVEVTASTVISVTSFSEDKAGNRSAEAAFRRMVTKCNPNAAAGMRAYIEDGEFRADRDYQASMPARDYQIFLVHSE